MVILIMMLHHEDYMIMMSCSICLMKRNYQNHDQNISLVMLLDMVEIKL